MTRFRLIAGVAAIAVITTPAAALATKPAPGGGGGPKQDVVTVTATQNVNEGAGPADVVVTRSGDTTCVFTLDYTTANDNSAVAGSDYTAVSGTQSWAKGEKTKHVLVPITNDNAVEQNEHF